MRILQVSPYDFPYPGGVTQHIINLDREFRARGHAVAIMAPSTVPEAEVNFPNFYRAGTRIVPLPVNQSTARVTWSPALLPRVRRYLSEHTFDVIHLHEALVPALPLLVLRASRSVNIGTFHAARKSFLFYRATRPLIHRWQQKLHGKIAVSGTARDLVYRYYKGEYRIIPNGIDVAFYGQPAEPIPDITDGKFNIMFLGRLEKRKGLDYLLQAMALVQQLRPQTRLIVVGGFKPAQRRRYQRSVETLGVRHVHFAGFVSDEDKRRYLQSSQVLCSPATGGESQGIVLLEGMAAGVPVVASDIPGFRSVLRDGEGAILVPPKDHVALARNLMRLIDNAAKRARMAEFGHRRAQDFAWDKIATRILDYYAEVRDEVGGDAPAWTRGLPARAAFAP
ncbi:MAG: glycosyltransferase family 4 protein [Actinobacteria bacterium]|nr:glycosyltransferase family 4 protein [Actinomycetota bacterium]